ncbi:MAG: pyridoxamine kinase [Lachnospiraceae bacterium]|nr:pyridoxamine kinase [Lachnospiraceae bacterium]
MKRVVTLQDISCVGKCSLTAAIPVLSCLGVEASVIPTALLSTHTAFESFIAYDLSDKIGEISAQLIENNIRFDAIYTGYLGSIKQIEEISAFIDRFRHGDCLVVVDPAMADDGMLYSGLPDDFVDHIHPLISKADVIIPNLTEACMLLDMDYSEPSGFSMREISEMLSQLSDMGPEKVVITGIHFDECSMGAVSYDRATDKVYTAENTKHNGRYLGTGDIFSSVVTGCLLEDQTIAEASKHAVDFVNRCIEETEKAPDKRWYGVNFESCLGELCKTGMAFNKSESEE